MKRTLTVPERHQLSIALRTMRMHCTGARIMGGLGDDPHREAALIIHRLTGKPATIDPDCTCVARQGKGDRIAKRRQRRHGHTGVATPCAAWHITFGGKCLNCGMEKGE